MPLAPYPFDPLPELSATEVTALRSWARALPVRALQAAGHQTKSWLGRSIELELGHPRPASKQDGPRGPAPSVLLEHREGRVGMGLDSHLATTLIERTLGAEDDPSGAGGPLGDVERGVLAYGVARWLGSTPWAVAGTYSFAPGMLEALGSESFIRWPFTISVGSVTGAGGFWLPTEARPAPSERAPDWAMSLPIRVRIEVGHAVLGGDVVGTLRPGDVLVPDRIAVDTEGQGTAELVAHARCVTASLERGALTVTGKWRERTPPTTGRRDDMTEPTEPGAMSELPVTLSLELARFELPFADCLALSPGEVVRTGSPLGGTVTVRAGDRVVARGELVDVEGEIGVRLTHVE